MKERLRAIRGVIFGETAKRSLLGGGLFGVSELIAGCALAMLAAWVAVALVFVLLWALVAFIASVIPL